ncbi:hypothetical protein H7U19_16415 [Hyunsoonleella sp. SJ7]|uniref:Lipoprotein n=1 Tax=Hyunsoonleella aquatilis TaxID=2762758 RepID=A0A923KMQ7_9FLAO|nr:DUF6146 family protein [Hyunsoonleella aquatilis]MBC3759998.1 hypothetical protein [Hyunsoonleella aquatilis]
MKHFILILLASIFIVSCNTSKQTVQNKTKDEKSLASAQNDTIRIANNELEYEIIIIEPGFNFWLASNARQRGHYGQNFMENRNWIYVIEWNQRVLQPQRFNPGLYELQINYEPNIDYGYEVNYLLYHYFIYFQLKYNQRLGPFVPRI